MRTDIFREQMEIFSKEHSFAEDFVLPDYQRLNVKNILPQIASILGVGSDGAFGFPKDYFHDLQDVKRVVLFIFDGLGYNRFLSYLSSHDGIFIELAEKGVLKPITTVFPATTSTVLASLFTGLSPAQHQILGYHMFSKKYGLVFATLDMKPVYGYSGQVELVKDYSRTVKPLLYRLEQNGVKTLVATKASIADSGLSEIIHRGQRLIPYLLGSDMLVRARKALEQQDPALLVMYYSGIDTLAHRYGPYSEEVTFELTSIEHNIGNFIGGLSEKTKKETLMILTADHGVVETRKTYFLRDIGEVIEQLALPPVGDSRAAFLFSKADRLKTFRDAFERNIEGFKLFSSNELIENGAFGQPRDLEGLREKVGDFTALGIGQNALQYPFFEDDRLHPMLGTHGGMTSEEMIIPFLSARLSKL